MANPLPRPAVEAPESAVHPPANCDGPSQLCARRGVIEARCQGRKRPVCAALLFPEPANQWVRWWRTLYRVVSSAPTRRDGDPFRSIVRGCLTSSFTLVQPIIPVVDRHRHPFPAVRPACRFRSRASGPLPTEAGRNQRASPARTARARARRRPSSGKASSH